MFRFFYFKSIFHFSVNQPSKGFSRRLWNQTGISENQIDKAIGYFDLLVAPEQNQTLEVIISNSSDEERTFEVSVNPAVTSDGGTIDYSQKKPNVR